MEPTGKPKKKNQYVREKINLKRKLSKKNKHRARLVVRNLPFEATEEGLRKHFEKFGEIDEVKLLKKEDGVLLGIGFVQFKLVQKAAKARHHLNGKPFLNRNIECDFALPKDKYEKKDSTTTPDPVQIKDEPLDDAEIKVEIKEEDIKQEDEDLDVTKEERESEKSSDSDEENQDDEDEDDIEFDEEIEVKDEEKPRKISNDVNEGKTIFIKNVPFAATNEDIKECMSQFGPLYYGVICMDQLTEHSKGTAFVKFKNKEDAEACLANKGITLMNSVLECERALSKDELKSKSEKKEKGPRDSRNLYLVKEGVILAGTKAAESVSATDMTKRLQIEQYKTQMLRNLNMFVARTRLVVHNIPPSWSDAQLKQLFLKQCKHPGTLKEAKIMRNMRDVDANGIGRSKEFGFVAFTTHDAALHALRALNNNPNIFSPTKRPIIAFSIENRSKLRAKERRLQNSKLKNPTSKSYDPNTVSKPFKKDKEKRYKQDKPAEDTQEGLQKFSGTKASFGASKMRSKFNLRTQAQVHHEQVKKEKKMKRMEIARRPVKQKEKKTKPLKQKLNKMKKDDNFASLVNSYKQTLLNANSADTTKKKKWYE
ncbi:hypothetical protein PPYR_05165 [Photinus pyralis]|uniref:RRM domain-containing protein n=1 Tax=Photinus pyralis TaxID=7054 RepID=A0A1Y1LCX0_PHOPY|nr:RNA-binding protein 28-like [Photinus pyralis]XP_031340610.1 RNA-binding protein 28-like [Photinus pyralis]XP_031340649.1 RNA-binding protein 28-like [Photinus pyralis]KAB0799358.1 hypothetical protein PPYR_07238 [Photinus pyralis]KAB0799399.1 hypothetical protein PPYR_07279 [Photinus pyralis]KAB0802979.1 hypothetical protein PPYR_05165 [Photinus pyralis]